MSEITITLTETGNGGRYAARIDGVEAEAELTYRKAGPGRIIANHTYAPPAMRGTGVAKALVERLVADARAHGVKILPTCSYVAAQAEQNPAWSDVMLTR